MKEKTRIWVYTKSPFKNDYANVINFETLDAMEDFFTKPNKHIDLIYKRDDFQYIERNGSIYVSGRVEEFEKATYMRFINNGRTYYAFIFDCIYQNEGTTELIYEIDVWNTYQQELKAGQVIGQIEQETLKNSIENLRDSVQGFQAGTKFPAKAGQVGIKTEWLVVVAKPTINLTTKIKRPNNMTFSGMQKSFKYFFIPVDLKTGTTKPFILYGKKYPSFYLANLYRHLFGLKENSGTTVNQIINMYLSRDIGIKYREKEEDGKKYIEILTNITATIQEIGSKNSRNYRPTSASGSGGGGSLTEESGDISTEESRVRLVTRLIKKLVPDATVTGIAGIIGNFSAESNVTAKKYEADYATGYEYDKMATLPTAENLVGSWDAFASLYTISLNEKGYRGSDGNHWIGMGIGQWTGPRCEALINYAKEKGKSVWDFSLQFNFMNEETRAETFQRIAKSSASAGDNASDFMYNWEGVNYKKSERIAEAENWLSTVEDELRKGS